MLNAATSIMCSIMCDEKADVTECGTEVVDNAHLIQDLMTRTVGRFNTIKIVPLITFQEVIESCKKIEDGSFFPSESTATATQ